VYFALLLALPAVLFVVALSGLHTLHRLRYGRLGAAGAMVSGLGLAAISLGAAVEALTAAIDGAQNTVAWVLFLLGFALLVVGSGVLGVGLMRARVLPRAAAWMLVLLVPITAVVGWIGDRLFPDAFDSGLWLALTLPYGLAWLILGFENARGQRSDR